MMRRNTNTIAMASVLVLALAAGAATASPKGWGEGRMGAMMPDFATLDTDGDGKITKAEMDALRAGRQAAMDPDGDGFITLEEMKAHAAAQARTRAEAMVDRMFAGLDTDKDGRLSAAEALSGPMGGQRGAERMFDRLDRDGDDAISKTEYARMAEGMGRKGRMSGEDRGDRHGHGKGYGRD